MSHINIVALSGRATRDPEYVEMQSGNNLAKFGLAVERSWVDKNTSERVVKTSFFDINVWGPFSDVIFAKVRKGDSLTLSGSIEQETWVDKESGQNRSKHIVNATQVDGEALFRKADGSDTPQRDQGDQGDRPGNTAQAQLPVDPPPAGVSSQGAAPDGGDGIPF